jgi:hypothetical protein
MAYIGKLRNGQIIFVGCKTTNAQDSQQVRLLAIGESIIKATELGFQRLIVLIEDRDIEKMWGQ